MRRLNPLILLSSFFLIAISGGKLFALDAKTEATMNDVLSHYLKIQENLASDTTVGVESEALSIAKTLSEFFNKPCKLEDAGCASVLQKIRIASEAIKGKEIQALRKPFEALSEAMVDFWKKFNPSWPDIFVFRCPMANQNQGASWLQKGPDLKNPYFGKSMSHCGLLLK